MHGTKLVLIGPAVAAVIAMAGCDPQPAAKSATAPATSAAATEDAATKKACDALEKDIKDNATLVAKAKKIGPPAGHIAVSAQWIAGSAAVAGHSIGANEKVSAAADKVQQAMSELSDEYNKSSTAKPSTKKLDAAVTELNTACSAA